VVFSIVCKSQLSWQELMLPLPFALAILFGDELRKVFVRRGNRFVLIKLTWLGVWFLLLS